MPDHGQVQLRLPLQPPASTSEARCGSPAAHISLRRFAQGYVFGVPARLGGDATSVPTCQSVTGQGSSLASSPPPAFATVEGADFAACAARAKQPAQGGGETARRRVSVSESPPVSSNSVDAESRNSRGPALPVRSRAIERKTVPKRCRDVVSVDALSAMVDRVLGSADTAGWRKRGSSKRLRAGEARPRTGAAAAFGSSSIPVEWSDGRSDSVDAQKEEKDENGESLTKLEEEDTADELSFLVEKCDLDSERKQSMFMPYIT